MSQQNKNSGLFLGIATSVLAIALLFVRTVYPELLWLTIGVGVLLVGALGLLIRHSHQALRSRTAAYGLNSFITVILVLGILGVLNFLAIRYPLKADLTKNKVNTLSDQTVKIVKGLAVPVRATVYTKTSLKEQVRPLLDNYRALNPNFEVEYVDPDREVIRVKQAGIRKLNTLQLTAGSRDTKVEDITEEKVTNALIKILKTKAPTLCVTTGHGEKSFTSDEAEGYSSIKKALEGQSYTVKDFNIVQDAKDGKVPASCDALAIIGPNKAFFENEIKVLRDYLAGGGRAVIAVDPNIKGGTEPISDLISIIETWNVKPSPGMIVDPISQMFNMDASVAVVSDFSKDQLITRETRERAPFPMTRPVDITSVMPGLTVSWLAKTSGQSWVVTDVKQLAAGQVKFVPGQSKNGPFNVAVSVEGKQKDSKASRNTRLVVFGTSNFATNHFVRFGSNLDLMTNSVSWALEDESMISIRAKEDAPSQIQISQKGAATIFWITVILIPLSIAGAGIVIWALRRRL